MFDRRCRGYEAIGYRMQLPGSAVPGWPADVPLPIDPEWKSQYWPLPTFTIRLALRTIALGGAV